MWWSHYPLVLYVVAVQVVVLPSLGAPPISQHRGSRVISRVGPPEESPASLRFLTEWMNKVAQRTGDVLQQDIHEEPSVFVTIEDLGAIRRPTGDCLKGHLLLGVYYGNHLELDVKLIDGENAYYGYLVFVYPQFQTDVAAMRPHFHRAKTLPLEEYWSRWGVSFDFVTKDLSLQFKDMEPVTLLNGKSVLKRYVAVKKAWAEKVGLRRGLPFSELRDDFLYKRCLHCEQFKSVAAAVDIARQFLLPFKDEVAIDLEREVLRDAKVVELQHLQPMIRLLGATDTKKAPVNHVVALSFSPQTLQGHLHAINWPQRQWGTDFLFEWIVPPTGRFKRLQQSPFLDVHMRLEPTGGGGNRKFRLMPIKT